MRQLPVLRGVATGNRYVTHLHPALSRYPLSEFSVNQARSYGIIDLGDEGELGYSRWVSPKRTRSYPFARLYNTYRLQKVVTIIPVIKDEGEAGDNDRINFITFSWMNLMNVYIILAWYDAASMSKLPGKITAQQLDSAYIRQQLQAISHYRQTALHWNTAHFQRDFADIYRRAVERYQTLGTQFNVTMHSAAEHLAVLDRFRGRRQISCRHHELAWRRVLSHSGRGLHQRQSHRHSGIEERQRELVPSAG